MQKNILSICFFAALGVVFAGRVFCEETFPEMAKVEADYILACQLTDTSDAAYGCINNVKGAPAGRAG